MSDRQLPVAVIGGGPAGLMAAEVISAAGYPVAVYDAMPSVGRKFLLAGVGGMNITHSEPATDFVRRYGVRQADISRLLENFDADALRAWIHGLGIETFVGTSGRVFPREMKAAPLLRTWLQRLRANGVQFHLRHRWLGWDEQGRLQFVAQTRTSEQHILNVQAVATVLALGGASWPHLGSDGRWVSRLQERGVRVAELAPSNCGFAVGWSDLLKSRHAGQPLKNIVVSARDTHGQLHSHAGEAILTENGIEGGAIYALSSLLREAIQRSGQADMQIDLLPDWSLPDVVQALQQPRGKNSFSNFLRKRLRLSAAKLALVYERLSKEQLQTPELLAVALKALPLTLTATQPIEQAISSAGGVVFEDMTPALMIKSLPGVFCVGEMLDWEAPTGGYLLTACFSSGYAAGKGVVDWLHKDVCADDSCQ